MSFNQFTNLDFESIRSQIKDYLRTNSNFSDFDFEGSNFSNLIDVLAYNSYITAFNTNMVVNESFIDSATVRENVVSLARNIGYVPRSKRAARALVSFFVNTTGFNSKTLTLKAGIVALGSVQSGNYIFSIPEDKTVVVDSSGYANFNNIEVYEGSYLTKLFVYDNSQPNQKFVIPNPSVDTSTIRVLISNTVVEEYKQYSNIFEVNKNSKIFLLQEVSDEKYQILFGDDILGKSPLNKSSIIVSYIVTNGSAANGAANFSFSGILVDNNANKITTGISLLNTTQSAENGDEIESVDSVKYLAPRVYSSQYRAVTANDYKGLINYLFPNIESVNAYGGDELTPPQYGKVFISMKPRNGSFLSQITKETIKKSLKQYSIAGIDQEIIDLKYLYVEIETNVYYNKGYTSNVLDLQSSVLNTIKSYALSSELNNFGGRFKYSKFVSLVDNTSAAITSNITKIKIRRNLQPALNALATYELCYGNQFHLANKATTSLSYNIKSTGFTVKDVSDVIYITDKVINSSKGDIVFFKLIDGVPYIVNSKAGTVYYDTGEIMLSPVIITGSNNSEGIQIEAIPESNDVISVRDIYLEINIPNTTVNMIEDTISSGENISGTKYAVTSSYINGNYTR
jgi:hypothetical protein